MNTLKKAVLAILFLLAFTGVSHAQAVLTQTTLSTAIGGGGQGTGYSGINSTSLSPVTLAATTNVTAASNGQPVSFLYVDTELMGVLTVNTTTNQVTVQRGVGGTKVTAHASGVMVLIGTNNQFAALDPDGACLSTGIISTPFINVLNGNQWLCSSITGTWVPGFRNGNGKPKNVTAAHNSATAAMIVSGPLFHVTGTSQMTSITVPVGCDATTVGSCTFTIIPDSTCSFASGNNIAAAATCVANKPLTFIWDPVNSKFTIQVPTGA